MKIKPDIILKNWDGSDLVIKPKGGREEKVLLKTILINALNWSGNSQSPLKITAEQKMKAYYIGMGLSRNKEVELTSEDVVFIKERLLDMPLDTLVYGQVVEFLEGGVYAKSSQAKQK